MKKLLTLFLIFIFSSISAIAVQNQKVKGYTKKNGTYVNSYNRTKSDRKMYNNYSTKGNYNPYTSKKGYKQEKNKTFNNRGY